MPTSRLIRFNENKCFLQFYLGLEHKQDKALNINKIWQLAAKVFPSSMFRPRSDSFNSEMICRKRHFHYVSFRHTDLILTIFSILYWFFPSVDLFQSMHFWVFELWLSILCFSFDSKLNYESLILSFQAFCKHFEGIWKMRFIMNV